MDVAGVRKKRKEKNKHDEQIRLLQGIFLNPSKLAGRRILLNGCLRSIIVFSVVFGSVGGFLSAFQINYNYMLVIFFYLLMAVYASLLYTAPKLFYRDFGYILFFAAFIPSIYKLRDYANSGLYEIVNRVLKQAEIFFKLPGIVEYEVQINDPYLTVSILAVFVGMVEILVLNIWIYITMSIGWTIVITFPILLLPIYMKQSPDLLYVVLLGIGYLAVLIFKANGHYMSFGGEKELRARGRKKDKLMYTQDTGMLWQVLSVLLVLCLSATGITGSAVSQIEFEKYFKSDTLRDNTSEIVGNVLLLGFGGIFNWYSSTGGINGGKLGGVASVRPDGQTDLEVSFTPYSTEAVYLKAFTGGIYGDNQWGNAMVPERDSLKAETELLMQNYAEEAPYSAQGKMRVKNVGANIEYLYFPYYTMHDNDPVKTRVNGIGIGRNREKVYTFYPRISREGVGLIKPADMDVSGVSGIFLDVPEKNREVIEKQCAEIGLNADMTENEIVEAVRTYFRENIPYTLRPGTTPRGKDFINYFLTKNRKGYCAHFASAAVLLFRQMGIPARYAEGYVFSMETAFDADINEAEQYADYYDGYSALGETAVLDVEVTDAMAHAWVEVYMDGFGWCVAEVTPGRAEASEEDDFWAVFTNILGNTPNADAGDGNAAQMLGGLSLSHFTWILYAFVGIVVCWLLWNAGGVAWRKIRRYRAFNGQDEREALIARYADVCDMERLVSADFDACRSHAEQLCYFFEKYNIRERENGDLQDQAENEDAVVYAAQISALLERISFSREQINGIEQEQIAEVIGSIRGAINREVGIRQKIRLFLR